MQHFKIIFLTTIFIILLPNISKAKERNDFSDAELPNQLEENNIHYKKVKIYDQNFEVELNENIGDEPIANAAPQPPGQNTLPINEDQYMLIIAGIFISYSAIKKYRKELN